MEHAQSTPQEQPVAPEVPGDEVAAQGRGTRPDSLRAGAGGASPPRDEPPELVLTPKAVEMAKKALQRRGTPDAALRLGVRGGGCSGVSYAIEFADKIRAHDRVFELDGLRVVVDPKSLVYLRGTVLDYEVKLMEHGFKFRNPNEKAGCGCGQSFGI